MDMRDTQTKHPGWQGKWETLGSISMFPGGCLVLHPFFPPSSQQMWAAGIPLRCPRWANTKVSQKWIPESRLFKVKLPCPVIWPVTPAPPPTLPLFPASDLIGGTRATSPQFPFLSDSWQQSSLARALTSFCGAESHPVRRSDLRAQRGGKGLANTLKGLCVCGD